MGPMGCSKTFNKKTKQTVMKKLKRWCLLFRGWKRCKVFTFCPKCNSDAPELYDCDVCCYYRGYPNKWLRSVWFNRYKKQLDENI